MAPSTVARLSVPSGSDVDETRTKRDDALHKGAWQLRNALFTRLREKSETEGAAFWARPLHTVSVTFRLKSAKSILPPAELRDEPEQLRWIARALDAEWGTDNKLVRTLHGLTGRAAIARYRDTTRPLVPEPLLDRVSAMPAAERDLFIRQWFAWFSHGDAWTTPGGKQQTPVRDATRILPTESASLTVSGRGAAFRAAVVLEISPLFVDVAAAKGNYLATVALPWDGDLGSPATWSPGERWAMWEAIFRGFAENYRYRTEAQSPTAPLIEVVAPATGGAFSLAAEHGDSAVGIPTGFSRSDLVTAPLADASCGDAGAGGIDRARPTFPIALGRTPVDRDVQAVIQQAGHFRFPRRWAAIPPWDKLVAEEIERILAQYSYDAMHPGPDGRPALLDQRVVRGEPREKWPLVLTKAAADDLKRRYGPKGFLTTGTRTQPEMFVRCVDLGEAGLVEMQVSWHGLAGPFVADWRERQKELVAERRAEIDANRLPLFEDLDAKELRKLESHLDRISFYEDGQRAMEIILGQVAKQGRTTVEIRADVFKTLFWPDGEAPSNWKAVVDDTLDALRHIDIIVRHGGERHSGGFLAYMITNDDNATPAAQEAAALRYIPRGVGGHGNGFYQLHVNPAFVGCLMHFEDGAGRLRGGGTTRLLNFGKDLSKEEKKKTHGKFVQFDAGTPLYSAGHSRFQMNLVRFIEGNITLKGDGIAGGKKGPRHAHKVRAGDLEEKLPRRYDQAFCPLLPPGQDFVAALGHFSNSPESGFTLLGTRTEPRRKSGARPGGLIEKMGRSVPPGNAHQRRRNVLEETVADLRRVVEADFGGMVVGRLGERDGDRWVPLDGFLELPDQLLGHRLKVYTFLPPDWDERRKAAFEERTGYRVTEDPAEAETAAWEGDAAVSHALPGETIGADNGWRGLKLTERLEAKMRHLAMKRKDLAALFRVSKGTVSQWLAANDPNVKTPPLRIPDDLAPIMVRWIETGEGPSDNELHALRSRSRSPARGRD